jgi:hypothetical protein
LTGPESEFLFGGATVEITPDIPTPLAGYSGPVRLSRAVASAIEANAVVLEGDSDRLLFMSLDVLFVGSEVSAAVQARAESHGVAPEHVFIVASHTHFAPATDYSKPLLGKVDAQWLDTLIERLNRLVDVVLTSPPRRVRLRLSTSAAPMNVIRRRYWPLPTWTRRGLRLRGSVVMAPSYDKPRDTSLDVITIVDGSGAVVAVFWKYACHPVAYPEPLSVSADFPGHVRERLRAEFGSAVPVVFLQGFAGDVRPRLSGSMSLLGRIRILRVGPGFGTPTLGHWRAWADQLAAFAIEAARSESPTLLIRPLVSQSASVPLAALLESTADASDAERRMVLSRVSFGDRISLFFVAAEVCSPYVSLIGRGARTLCVGYLGDVFGYLPSQSQVLEGGYEAEGFFSAFGLSGRFRQGFERSVADVVDRLIDE